MNGSVHKSRPLLNNKAHGANGVNLDFQFRLVNIQPACLGPQVRCSLETVTLGASSGEYEALSYHWGKFDAAEQIELDGQLHVVRRNLLLALQNIRHRIEHRRFFIDALCINQSDSFEKSSQVQSMWAIYEYAQKVVVFLGDEGQNTYDVFNWITSTGKLALSSREDSFDNASADGLIQSLEGRISIHEGLRDILSRPWWSRVWVVQEIAVPKNVLVQCGAYTTSWKYWDVVIEAYFQAVMSPEDADPMISWMPPFATDNSFLGKPIAWDFACAIQTARRRVQKSEMDHGLAPLLIRFRLFECSDARDKIYGLFRLSHQFDNIEPDYSKSKAKVYMQAVQESIQRSGGLALFSMLDYDQRDLSIPTWCPNFHGLVPKGDPFYRRGYNSAKGCKVDVHVEDGAMILAGFCIGVIESILSANESLSPFLMSSFPNESLEEVMKRCLNTIETLSISKSEVFWIRQQQALHTTPCSVYPEKGDHFFDHSGKSEERIYVENYLQKILKETKTALDYDHVGTMTSFEKRCNKAGRQLAKSSKGDCGLVPLSAEVGDVLVVFLGGRVPFCLRQVSGLSNSDNSEYHLIGDCYVDGYMQGEAIPPDVEKEKQHFRIV